TVWGPGILSGRAIMALGEQTLKVFGRIIDREALAIQWRLVTIRRTAPCECGEGDTWNIPRFIHGERSRVVIPGSLSRGMEIGLHSASHGCLYRKQISSCMNCLSRGNRRRQNQLLCYWRNVIQFHKSSRDWGSDPILDFLTILIQLSPEMHSACCSVISKLSENPNLSILFLRFPGHPMLQLYTENNLRLPALCRTPLAKLQLEFFGDRMYRWNTWKALTAAGHPTEARLHKIEQILLSAASTNQCWTPQLFDAAVDLFDFLLHSRVPEHKETAVQHLTACLAVEGHHSWEPLRLAFSSFKGRLKLMCDFYAGTYEASTLEYPTPFPTVKVKQSPLLCGFLLCGHLDGPPELEAPPPPYVSAPTRTLDVIPEADEES
ncbi:hypothetical protein FB45DRAFT_932680, partial [Roridomyces roridus]